MNMLSLSVRKSVFRNELRYGDNIEVMQNMPAKSVDLIYLDPPFNSDRTYNLIYTQLTGTPIPEQEFAFKDAWTLDNEKLQMARNMEVMMHEEGIDKDIIVFWHAWVHSLKGTHSRLLAYLIYMSVRLLMMRKLLKPEGAIYFHCDPSASHYIKVFMDSIFGHQNFRNDIIWKRTNTHNDSRTWSRVNDNILFYTRSSKFTWNVPREAPNADYVTAKYRGDDGDGRLYMLDNMTSPTRRPNMIYEWKGFPSPENGWRYSKETMARLDAEGKIYYPQLPTGDLDHSKRPRFKRYLADNKGAVMGNVWTDIAPMNSRSKDRLGYPTQKPQPLLERIIKASTNPGDVVFDPFCGCGTAVFAAHELGRSWIGCDIAIWSVRIIRDALLTRYGLKEGVDYKVSGVPLTVEGAVDLFKRDARQFEHWAVELVGGFSTKAHSGDRGIDGRIYFETPEGLRNMILSVKGGKVRPEHTRELIGTVAREDSASLGGLICLQEPTRGMRHDAATAGFVSMNGIEYPLLQLRTVEELLQGKGFMTPAHVQTMQWRRDQPALL